MLTLSMTSHRRRYLLSAVYVAAGQALNIGIFSTLGKEGVYYGYKLGKTIPWVTGFPFNLGLRHPQYVGNILTWWGVFQLLISSAVLSTGFLQLATFGMLGYTVIGMVEENSDHDATQNVPTESVVAKTASPEKTLKEKKKLRMD